MVALANRTWCRLVHFKQSQPDLLRGWCRCYARESVKENDGVIQKIKKIVFGEGDPSEQQPIESYYELSGTEEPVVYGMEVEEIQLAIESITKEFLTEEKDWSHADVSDIILKYKVLNRCYEQFGLIVPNHQLKNMILIQDVLSFYTAVKKPDANTFQSIDINNLPPNLRIGGKVPRKEL